MAHERLKKLYELDKQHHTYPWQWWEFRCWLWKDCDREPDWHPDWEYRRKANAPIWEQDDWDNLKELTDLKTTNQPPKTQLQLVPPVLEEEVAKALEVGAKKYGVWNWREEGRCLSTMEYVRAIRSHLNKYIEGEDYDEEGQHHLGAIGATCAILLDAGKVGNLKDDRP